MFKSDVLYVQYHGSHRTTQSCLDALARLLASSIVVRRARLLTHDGRHGFYIDVEDPEAIFIRCGFASGYGGEGPAGLAITLHLLERFRVEMEEIEVPADMLARLDAGALRSIDLQAIEKGRIVRPVRFYDYMHEGLRGRHSPAASMRKQFATMVPWSILDERLIEIALQLEQDPDRAVFKAFRKLELQVKARCGMASNVHGVQVFRNAFRGSGAALCWPGLPASEVEGRAQLFEAAFMAYRNPRAHSDVGGGAERAYRELYVVNELFLLESEAESAQDG
ncbi:MAG: TIGR02391 family protein [Luteimonas sp.]|nr:TIGR02391 family protein [Luteimonas sp.]